MKSKLLFCIDNKQYYKNHLNGTTHLLIQNWSKSDLKFINLESLCDDNSEHLVIYNLSKQTEINCPKCKMILNILETDIS